MKTCFRFLAPLVTAVALAALALPPASAADSRIVAGRVDLSALNDLIVSRTDDVWGMKPLGIETELPDFALEHPRTRGGNADVEEWQKATAIVVTPRGWGSGAIISDDGWILTNYHVVESLVQEASVGGSDPVRCQILLCEITERGPRKLESTLPATVYRVDPVRDLALLKLDARRQVSHFELADGRVKVQTECFTIGSHGGGLPWTVRRGQVNIYGDFPMGFTEFVAGFVDSADVLAQRTRCEIVISSCGVSQGDSGGPLVDDEGRLIGLTFAGPTNMLGGASSFHIAAPEIHAFLDPMPGSPEPVPFDPWIAGYAGISPGGVQLRWDEMEGTQFNLLVVPLMADMGEAYQQVASTVFLDLENRSRIVPDPEQISFDKLVPAGLWARNPGGFRSDACVVCRADRVHAVGYAGSSGRIDEIRIDGDTDGMSDVVWKLADGSWRASAPDRVAMRDVRRLGPRGSHLVDAIFNSCRELESAAAPEN